MEDKFQHCFKLVKRTVDLLSFEHYILESEQYQHELFQRIRSAKTDGLPRFNIWRMLLEVIPITGNWQQKQQQLQSGRQRWLTLKEEAKTGVKSSPIKQSAPSPKNNPLMPRNPLMKAMVKPDKKQPVPTPESFLREQIKKDVDRTYQQLPFFQQPNILKLLTDVLFVWCRINPDVSYKQGINELLASVVYVYFQQALPIQFVPNNQLEQQYFSLNSAQHAEADIYLVFQRIMDIQKEMFKQNFDSDVKGLVNPNSKNNSPILQRIIQIQDHKLKALDLELFRIIKLQDVKTKTFLLRWIRCLHTRQFGLDNSLPVWDSIFLDAYESANSKNKHQFQFVDAMCLAMFLYMRSLVLTRETANEILQIYQKYPQIEGDDLAGLIALGWQVCESLRNMGTPLQNTDEITKAKDRAVSPVTTQRKQSASKEPEQLYPTIDLGEKKQSRIYFESQELQKLIGTLRQSISYNQDAESKSLAKLVLAALQQKLPN